MAAMNTSQAAPSDPIALLWKIARMWLVDAIEAFGGPAEVAAMLARRTRRAVKRRLKALEALVMKLLLVEAAKLGPGRSRVTHTHAQTPSDKQQPVERACVSLPDPADPSTWRARFVLRIPPEAATKRMPANTGPRIRDLGPPLLVRDIFADMARSAQVRRMAALRAGRMKPDEARERAKAEALARRFEALARVFANPLPYARRLWRKLKSLARRAYDAAMRIGMRLVRHGEPAVDSRATFESCRVASAFAFNSS
jgi:hypothetical protein